ncbi:DUF2252 domain-containing protein [Leucobacter sp.]
MTLTTPSSSPPTTPPDPFGDWHRPESASDGLAAGRRLRSRLPRRSQAELPVAADRDPLGILAEQNRTRLQHLVPLRTERMSLSPFAFYRGTAAIMAADLAAGPHSGVTVPSCGDAHISNFGFYASPQRTLVFDLNDFDEAAWAPWEWDLKRLVASVVIAGQAGDRDEARIREAVLRAVRAYARALRAGVLASPTARYFAHFDPEAGMGQLDPSSQQVLRTAIKHARKRTGERAARRLTETDERGRLVFVERPPTMTKAEPAVEEQARGYLRRYLLSANADVRQLMHHYVLSDIARRVVGVGSVGTRCSLALLQDGDGHALVMQAKQAVRSVLEQYGGIAQPLELQAHVAQHGEGGRVVALQRMLQSVSDPFLGYVRGDDVDLYVRQFHDMKGGIEAEAIDDEPFVAYAQACAVTLARAHCQARRAAVASGYVGGGRALGEALLEWGYAYAALSLSDYRAFVAARA